MNPGPLLGPYRYPCANIVLLSPLAQPQAEAALRECTVTRASSVLGVVLQGKDGLGVAAEEAECPFAKRTIQKNGEAKGCGALPRGMVHR